MRSACHAETAIGQPATTAAAIMRMSQPVTRARTISTPEAATTPQVFQVFQVFMVLLSVESGPFGITSKLRSGDSSYLDTDQVFMALSDSAPDNCGYRARPADTGSVSGSLALKQ